MTYMPTEEELRHEIERQKQFFLDHHDKDWLKHSYSGNRKNSSTTPQSQKLSLYLRNMDKKEIFDRIEYVVACVGAFAQRYNLSTMQAYAYLRRFTGIDFLLDCYAAEHTLSIEDAVSDLQAICHRKGGRIC